MHMIQSRITPFIEVPSLALRRGREVLFRDRDDAFILYLSDGMDLLNSEERIIRIGTREALIWLNETLEEGGAFWR